MARHTDKQTDGLHFHYFVKTGVGSHVTRLYSNRRKATPSPAPTLHQPTPVKVQMEVKGVPNYANETRVITCAGPVVASINWMRFSLTLPHQWTIDRKRLGGQD